MAKLYASEAGKRISTRFNALELGQYLNKQYYELTGDVSSNLSSSDPGFISISRKYMKRMLLD